MRGRGALALAESAHPDHLLMAPMDLYAPRPRAHGGWTSGPPRPSARQVIVPDIMPVPGLCPRAHYHAVGRRSSLSARQALQGSLVRWHGQINAEVCQAEQTDYRMSIQSLGVRLQRSRRRCCIRLRSDGIGLYGQPIQRLEEFQRVVGGEMRRLDSCSYTGDVQDASGSSKGFIRSLS
jgi:hypothetical protein